MKGLRYDFASNDIVLSDGAFATAITDSQTCALIALSQVCRITRPDIGTQIGSKLENGGKGVTSTIIAAAVREVEADGGKNVSITIDEDDRLQFLATYDYD